MSLKFPEKYEMAKSYGGRVFRIPRKGQVIMCIASVDGGVWEHVSVTISYQGREPQRCPTWDEMCVVKDLFWEEEDKVIQIHPEKSNYANLHPFCLHLWRPVDGNFRFPVLIDA